MNKRQQKLLPVNYFMVTFALPSEFLNLCQKFPEKIYNAFFAASSAALKELALNKRYLGDKIGMLGALHAWRRDGQFHPHIHYVVPGGGLSLDGEYWVYPQNRNFLVAVRPLMKLFRGKFKAEFGKQDLPPKILSKIVARVFISNERIEKYDNETVTFRYKETGTMNVKRRKMTAVAFMMMFLQHVLPSGQMSRRYRKSILCTVQRALVISRT